MNTTVTTTYTQARANLAKFCNRVVDDHEIVVIQRRDAEDVALVSLTELEGLLETAHLLRSSRNAERLLTALARAKAHTESPQTVAELRRELNLENEVERDGEQP